MSSRYWLPTLFCNGRADGASGLRPSKRKPQRNEASVVCGSRYDRMSGIFDLVQVFLLHPQGRPVLHSFRTRTLEFLIAGRRALRQSAPSACVDVLLMLVESTKRATGSASSRG